MPRPVLFALIALLAVGVFTMPLSAATPDEVVRRCIDLLQTRDPAALDACIAPDERTADIENAIRAAQDAFQIGPGVVADQVSSSFFKSTAGGRTDTLVYHVKGSKNAILVFSKVRDTTAGPQITSLRWEPAPLDINDRYPFTLSGVDLPRILVLVAALALLCFMVACAVHCLRHQVKRKWLWLLFITLGVGKVVIPWVPIPFQMKTTPIAFQFFCIGVSKFPLYDPWVITLAFPLGAVLYLRQAMRNKRDLPSQASGVS